VRQTLDDLGLDYICRTAPKGSKQREIMVKLGGKEQVPFLVDQAKGVMMYESEEIIKYLEGK
jgi:glutaredoxin